MQKLTSSLATRDCFDGVMGDNGYVVLNGEVCKRYFTYLKRKEFLLKGIFHLAMLKSSYIPFPHPGILRRTERFLILAV